MTIDANDRECIRNIADAIGRGETIRPDGAYGKYLRDLADRLCPKVEWTHVGDGAMAVCCGWTLIVYPSCEGEPVFICRKNGGGGPVGYYPTIDAAKSAAVKWARENPVTK